MGCVDKRAVTMAVYFFGNLLSFMDRFSLAGVLSDIQVYFNITDSEGGLIQTLFTVAYMAFAPLFGYLGDRYSRKLLIAVSIVICSSSQLAGSFMEHFWPFVGTRILFGVGTSGFIIIAPTIISDIYTKDMRSRMLALYCFAIPVGSGLGYIVGSAAAGLGGSWNWALRVTPGIGILCVFFVYFTLDPERGKADGGPKMETTSWGADVKYLLGNPTYILTTFGVTAVNFIAGSLTWWGAKYLELGQVLQNEQLGDDSVTAKPGVPFKFGLIAMLAGIIGVVLGLVLSQKLRPRFPRADPLICGVGLLISAPLILTGLLLADTDTTACFVLILFGQVFLNMNWSVASDIRMYVVVPTRRATASALQIFVGKALGDAVSPYLIGVISDMFKNTMAQSGVLVETQLSTTASNATIDYVQVAINFKSLQYASYIAIVIEVLGGLLFIAAAWFLVQDKAKVDKAISDSVDDEELHKLNRRGTFDPSPTFTESWNSVPFSEPMSESPPFPLDDVQDKKKRRPALERFIT